MAGVNESRRESHSRIYWGSNLERVELVSRYVSGRKCSKQREQPVQSPFRGSMLSVSQEQQGGWVSYAERAREEILGNEMRAIRAGQTLEDLVSHHKDFRFYFPWNGRTLKSVKFREEVI